MPYIKNSIYDNKMDFMSQYSWKLNLVNVSHIQIFWPWYQVKDRLCGLVIRVPGYKSRGHEFDSRRYQVFWETVGLERGPLSLVRIISFNSHSGGWSPNWVQSARRPFTGLLHLPRLSVRMENLVQWILAGETEILKENLPQNHSLHHKSHLTKPGPPRWEASD
jgi:hypothetical protein